MQRFAYVGMLNLRATLGKAFSYDAFSASKCAYESTKK